MSILSGFKKVRRHIRLPGGYKLLSFWTSSQTVEMDDGTTLESNKATWDDASEKKHEHTNKAALDSITSEKVSKWNTSAESNVTGIKGNTESSYRTGNVNLTSANIGALPTTGGTLTGNISFNMNSSTQTPIKIYGGDTNGQGISVGAGGATIVGGGESAKALESVVSATNEQLHLASDNDIYFNVNCNTIANRLQVILDKSRNFYPATNNNGSIGTSSYKWSNVYTSALNGTTLSSNARASSSVPGLMKLYASTGTGTDGTMTQKAISEIFSSKIKCMQITGTENYGASTTIINGDIAVPGTTYIGAIILRDSVRGFIYLPFNITALKNAGLNTNIVCQTYKDGKMVTYTFPFTSTIIDDNHVRLTLETGQSSGYYSTGANYIKIMP